MSSSGSSAGLLTTTVSDASVSGDSVGDGAGDASRRTSIVSGCCRCFGCIDWFASRWSWSCVDSSPVPGASSFGSSVAGDGGGSGRTSAKLCALMVLGLLFSHREVC